MYYRDFQLQWCVNSRPYKSEFTCVTRIAFTKKSKWRLPIKTITQQIQQIPLTTNTTMELVIIHLFLIKGEEDKLVEGTYSMELKTSIVIRKYISELESINQVDGNDDSLYCFVFIF